MNLTEFIKKQQLEQLTANWKHLTPLQRKIITLRVRLLITQKRLPVALHRLYHAPIRLLNNLHTYQHPAHWLHPTH